MQIQWYPGHMTKARRAIEDEIRQVDLVVELTDARAVRSSRNPDIDRIAGNKARLVLINKADMADEAITRKWVSAYKKNGIYASAIDARNRDFKKQFLSSVQEATTAIRERDQRRGIKNRVIRTVVLGIPNVGKSTMINTLAGRATAKTGNKPGVTRGNQWIHVGTHLDLLDTPGILWPKFEDEVVGMHLAMTGAISDDVLNEGELALELLSLLGETYGEQVKNRYGDLSGLEKIEILPEIARRRSMLKKGGEPDYDRAARVILDEFRSGKLGRISLEEPNADGQ